MIQRRSLFGDLQPVAAARAEAAAAAALRAAGKTEAQARDIIAAHFHGSGK